MRRPEESACFVSFIIIKVSGVNQGANSEGVCDEDGWGVISISDREGTEGATVAGARFSHTDTLARGEPMDECGS